MIPISLPTRRGRRWMRTYIERGDHILTLLQPMLFHALSPRTHPTGGTGGSAQVKHHIFFNGVDWQAVLARRAVPPIRPCDGASTCPADLSTRNFEKEFTGLEVSTAFQLGDNHTSTGAIFGNFPTEAMIRTTQAARGTPAA